MLTDSSANFKKKKKFVSKKEEILGQVTIINHTHTYVVRTPFKICHNGEAVNLEIFRNECAL